MKIKNPCARPPFFCPCFQKPFPFHSNGMEAFGTCWRDWREASAFKFDGRASIYMPKGYSAQCSVGRERKPLLKGRRSYVTPTSISRQFTRVQNHEMQNTFFVPLTDCCKAFFYFKIGAVPFLSWCTLSLTKEEEEGNFI